MKYLYNMDITTKVIVNSANVVDAYPMDVKDNFVWIPNAIDTENIPKIEGKKGWVYFGNVTSATEIFFDFLKSKITNLTVISNNKVNGNGEYTREELLDILKDYSYGIGVGRSLLDMLAIGLKCLVVGRFYGGTILNDSDFFHHQKTNFNGQFQSTTKRIDEDIKNLIASDYIVDRKNLDMRSYLDNYVNLIESM